MKQTTTNIWLWSFVIILLSVARHTCEQRSLPGRLQLGQPAGACVVSLCPLIGLEDGHVTICLYSRLSSTRLHLHHFSSLAGAAQPRGGGWEDLESNNAPTSPCLQRLTAGYPPPFFCLNFCRCCTIMRRGWRFSSPLLVWQARNHQTISFRFSYLAGAVQPGGGAGGAGVRQ